MVRNVGMQRWCAASREGDDDDGDDDDEGRIFTEHPSPILHAPRDIISRKGQSLTPTICKGNLPSRFAGGLREVGGAAPHFGEQGFGYPA